MPSVITSTTTQALEPLLIDRIRQIVPTHTTNQALGWVPSPENRSVAESSLTHRLFYIEFVPGGDAVAGGLTGNGDVEQPFGLDVIADYRAFDETERGTVVEMDAIDLRDDLEVALDPVIPGLSHVELSGEPQPDDDDAARFRYQFTCSYMRVKR